VFIAFTFSHFPGREGDVPNEEMRELTRVANKMTGSLGFEYFWCCMSCHSDDGTVTDLIEAMDRGVGCANSHTPRVRACVRALCGQKNWLTAPPPPDLRD
jgi:hypothetical protein